MEEERLMQMVEEIKIKLTNLSHPHMCVMRLTYTFMIYIHNVMLLRDNVENG